MCWPNLIDDRDRILQRSRCLFATQDAMSDDEYRSCFLSVPKYQREALARFDANGDAVFTHKPYQAQSIHDILDKMAAPAD